MVALVSRLVMETSLSITWVAQATKRGLLTVQDSSTLKILVLMHKMLESFVPVCYNTSSLVVFMQDMQVYCMPLVLIIKTTFQCDVLLERTSLPH